MSTSNGDCNQEQKAPMMFQWKMLTALPFLIPGEGTA